jgi:hypothetical protein
VSGLFLDSGAVSYFASATLGSARARLAVLNVDEVGPPIVPSLVLTECLTGHPDKDARTNLFLKGCEITAVLSEARARRAANLRTMAGRGSAVDAALVALAEPGGLILTGDVDDLTALAANAIGVGIGAI